MPGLSLQRSDQAISDTVFGHRHDKKEAHSFTAQLSKNPCYTRWIYLYAMGRIIFIMEF